jgi:hypothetical protein
MICGYQLVNADKRGWRRGRDEFQRLKRDATFAPVAALHLHAETITAMDANH